MMSSSVRAARHLRCLALKQDVKVHVSPLKFVISCLTRGLFFLGRSREGRLSQDGTSSW